MLILNNIQHITFAKNKTKRKEKKRKNKKPAPEQTKKANRATSSSFLCSAFLLFPF